ncbi:g2627 [Coccomyxa elongata]
MAPLHITCPALDALRYPEVHTKQYRHSFCGSRQRPRLAPRITGRKLNQLHTVHVNPLDIAWGTSVSIDAQSLAANLFASSIFPYAAFLYYLTRSKKTPGLALFGFYFLLVFVFATIPAGIYAKTHYGTILANVDWLHGSAESLLTITNLMIVLGVREGIRQAQRTNGGLDSAKLASSQHSTVKEEQRT